jgi:hypothetical protein
MWNAAIRRFSWDRRVESALDDNVAEHDGQLAAFGGRHRRNR